jgi:hypothetical protein
MNSFRDQNVEAGRQQGQQLRAKSQASCDGVDFGSPEKKKIIKQTH